MTLTGLELKRVINTPIIEKFQIQGKYIYFYNTSDSTFCKADLDGENITKITDKIAKNANYNVTDKRIYYYDKENNSISSMNLKGEDIEIIKEINAKKTKINIVGDEIYYLDSSLDPKQAYQIFRVGIDGKKLKEIKY